jgi:carboxylesterase type B
MQPPVKDLRWRAPQQLDESWKPSPQRELVDAREFGSICIQQPAVAGVGQEGTFRVELGLQS